MSTYDLSYPTFSLCHAKEMKGRNNWVEICLLDKGNPTQTVKVALGFFVYKNDRSSVKFLYINE